MAGIGSFLGKIGQTFAPQFARRNPMATPPFVPGQPLVNPEDEDTGLPARSAGSEIGGAPPSRVGDSARPPAMPVGAGAAPSAMPTYRPDLDEDQQRLLEVSRQPTPAHPRHGKARSIGEALTSQFLGQPLSETIWDRGYQQQRQDYERQLADAARTAKIRGQAEKGAADVSHTMATGALAGKQAENYDADTLLKAVERGGELPDETGQPAAPPGAEPPKPRRGSNLTVAGKKVFFPTKGQVAEETLTTSIAAKAAADRAAERELPSVVTEGLGLPAGFKVPPGEVDSYVRIYETKVKAQGLHFESHTDDAGNVVTVGRDPVSGQEKFRDTLKGAGKTRSEPQGPQGSFQPLVNATGEVLEFFNPTTGQRVASPVAGARRTPLPPTENIRRATLSNSLEDVTRIGGLATKHKDKLGKIMGNLTSAQMQTLGEENPEVADLFRTSDNLADQLLRLRSGAAITEGEYQRMLKLVPNPRGPYSTFMGTLKSFQDELQRIAVKSTGGQVSATGQIATPGIVSPAANAGGPAVGTVQDGYRFKGGDPAQQANWEKVR